jgi:hypothetical protein
MNKSDSTGFEYFLRRIYFGTVVATPSITYGSAPPVSGTYNQGSLLINTVPINGSSVVFWRCVATGTPGTWESISGGGSAVVSVQGGDGITPGTAQTGVVTLSGLALLPRDGTRAMTAALPMGGFAVSNASTGTFSGALTALSFNGVALTTGGAATNFLNAAGTYTVPAGAVASVQGTGGLTPVTPTTGAVSLSGANLYARDGSNGFMSANVNMGAFGILNIGSAGLRFAGPTPYMFTDGNVNNYGLPQYPPNAEGAVLVGDGVGNGALSKFNGQITFNIAPAGRSRLGLDTGTSTSSMVAFSGSGNEYGFVGYRYSDTKMVLGSTALATGLVLASNTYEAKWPTAEGTSGQALTTNGAGQLAWTTVGGGAPGLESVLTTNPSANNRAATLLKTVSFFAVFDAGVSGVSKLIDFNNGQKQKLSLTGNAAITFSFPGVGNYLLRLTQDGTGGRLPTWPATARAALSTLQITTGISTETILNIYYDGALIWISSSPSLAGTVLSVGV